MAKQPSERDQDSPQEVVDRMNAALKRALNTPPKPHKPKAGKPAAKPAKEKGG
jgi:hypothetical protein